MVSGPGRSYAAAHFALELDGGDPVGLFRSIEGGGVRTDVASYQSGGNYERWRQLGKPKFEDLKLQVGMAMSSSFYTWIASFFAGRAVRKNGAIVAADFCYVERARRELTGALITELTFPKLDGADRAAAYMTVGLAVESIAFKRGDAGRKLAPPAGLDAQKLWTASNFRFRVDGLDDACRRVSKLDAFTIKQPVIEYHAGGALAPQKTAGAVDFPNLAFYVPEADAQPFADAMAARTAPLTGVLECFANGGRTLCTVSYRGAAIIAMMPDHCDAASEEIKLVKVELCTEGMEFRYAR